MDPGGAAPSVLTPPPAPNAIVGASPGLSHGATAPPVGPTLPDPTDPQAMALLFAKVAGELFGGSSVVPTPSPAQLITGGGLAPPGSPGISPTLVPGPTSPGADPSSAATFGRDPSGPVSGVGDVSSRPPGMSPPVDPHAGVGGSPPGSPGGLTPPGRRPIGTEPATGGRSQPSYTMAERTGASSEQPTSAPSYSVPFADDTSSHRGSAATSSMASTGAPSAPSANELPATSVPNATSTPGGVPTFSGSPFGAPLDLSSIGGMPSMSMSVLPEPSTGALPYYMPGADALGLESGGSQPVPGKPHGDDALARDLGRNAFDPYAVRKDFPILEERVHGGKRLVWLDNAATTQKPRYVIDRISYFYEHENSNVHRAAHTLAARSTDAFEKARESVRRFLNAPTSKEIVWVRGATEGINLIAQSWGRRHVGKGDEIVITHLEHHANIVPWQMLCAEKGATLRVAPVDDRGDVILEEYEKLMGPKTRLVSIPHVSNALGTITPAKQMVEIAHRYGAHVMVDGAQAVSHMKVDVQDLGCEWYVFSGHKVFGPTGIGAVWGKSSVLEVTPPWQGGGNMIEDVTFEKTRYQPPPFRFEAGTGSIADAVGLGAAIEYIERIGMDVIDRYEHELLVYGTQRLATVPGLTMVGTSPNKAGVLSFVLDGQRTEDVSAALDKEGIAVRSGHHCAQPILRRFGHEATVRASLAFYNVFEDLDALVEALHRLQGVR
ncbi:family 2A encapsulin nanocompartment cargo protein cysteine desulfurase [soil metagenome]